MRISQIGNLGPRATELLAKLLELYPMLRFAEFRLDSSTHMHSVDKQTTTGTAARAENASGQRDAQVPSTEAKNLSLYTREVSIDKVRMQDKVLGVGSEQQKQFAERRMDGLVIAMGEEIQRHMLAGTYTSNQMLGLLELIKDADSAGQTARLGFSAAELADMNVQVSLKLDTVANQDAFVEILEKEYANVPGANGIICNTSLGARISTIARRLGAAGVTTDSFANPVDTINNKPLIKVPENAIPNTMSDGTNSDNTALFIVRFAESQGLVYSTNTGFLYQDFGEVEEAPSNVARCDCYLSTTVEKSNAVRRLSRIRL